MNKFDGKKSYEILTEKEVFVRKSGKKGPKVCILAGVHGNEVGGIEAIKQILSDKSLRIKKGEITFVFANPRAIEKKVRFVEENLNRCFLENKPKTNSYEEKLAIDLKKILKSSDICLDLHSSFTQKSTPFIICEENAFELVKNFPISRICSGFDEFEPGGTDYYMNLIGKIGICLECGYLEDDNSQNIAQNCILTFLSNLKMLGEVKDFLKKEEKNFLRLNLIYLAKGKFVLEKAFEDFAKLSKGDLIGRDEKEKIFAKEEGFIVFARNRLKKEFDREAFLFGINL